MPSIRPIVTLLCTVCASLAAQSAWAACYVVYNAKKEIVYRAQTPPVDMSRNLHETLPQVAPGGILVFTLESEGCELEVHKLPKDKLAATARPSKKEQDPLSSLR